MNIMIYYEIRNTIRQYPCKKGKLNRSKNHRTAQDKEEYRATENKHGTKASTQDMLKKASKNKDYHELTTNKKMLPGT